MGTYRHDFQKRAQEDSCRLSKDTSGKHSIFMNNVICQLPSSEGLTWSIPHCLDALNKLGHPCLWVLEYPSYPIEPAMPILFRKLCRVD